ncbi:MAG TPA: HAD-IA family hydrolase [Desulfuromonadales bacterium]|nr:HAD-IA family hydrolase [Desulfuromonadales bacterium]
MTVRAVLFDLDGTLVDSLGDLTDAVNHVVNVFSLPLLCESDVRLKIGKGSRNLMEQILPGFSEADITRALDLFLDYNRQHIAVKSRLYPGILDTIHNLACCHIKLAVITNKNEDLCLLLLHDLGIKDLFESVCGGDSYPERKPSPLPLLKIAEQLGVPPNECVMIGDSINDVESGRRAAMMTIACSWGYGDMDEQKGADMIVHAPTELCEAIEHMSGQQT